MSVWTHRYLFYDAPSFLRSFLCMLVIVPREELHGILTRGINLAVNTLESQWKMRSVWGLAV